MPGVQRDETAGFYDDLAGDYHLIFADWETSIARQAGVIWPLLGAPPMRVLDAACGIGTQALGLAAAGFEVTATDISARSVERCEAEAQARGLSITTAIADLRNLGAAVEGPFDAVIAIDNALPHLLTDGELLKALKSVRSMLVPGGRFVGSIRDYDLLLEDRPSGEEPRITRDGGTERMVFQAWEWQTERTYRLRHFVGRTTGEGWELTERSAKYRALLRSELTALLKRAGFGTTRWVLPENSGFYQPMFVATA